VSDEASVPEILYHYTNSAGLLGIIKSKTLWATHVRFLNDESEVRYSRKLLGTVVERFEREYEGNTHAEAVFSLVGLLVDSPTSPDTFAASMCANGDLLSQWRGYGGQGGGYAVGFHRERLNRVAHPQSFEFAQVMYSVSEQEGQLEKALRDAIQIVADYEEQDALGPGAMELMLGIGFTAAMLQIKNPHFQEEAEWRLVRTYWLEESVKGTHMRTRGAVLIPCLEIALTESNTGDLPIVEVVVGPSRFDEAEAGVGYLLKQHNLEHVEIRRSDIPFRG
jgi:hypothetical protein